MSAYRHNTLLFAITFTSLLTQASTAGILGTAQNFAVLAGSTVTNTGSSVITGDAGVWPGSAMTGFPPAIMHGTLHAADAVAGIAQADVTIAYNSLASMIRTADLTGIDLGNQVLTPGVYFFSSSAQLTSTLVLDAQGNPDAIFVFQIGSTLTTANSSAVSVTNAADACNIYWQVGSSATLGTNTAFQGNILAMASITLNTGASIIEGRALARTGAVTLDSNSIVAGCIPSPGTCSAILLLGSGAAIRRRRVN
ncbi:MAG: ice-binding family protein [Planctomycetota bacterium]|nr:ice-binding family protein [Planctomycetota bacterium]